MANRDVYVIGMCPDQNHDLAMVNIWMQIQIPVLKLSLIPIRTKPNPWI